MNEMEVARDERRRSLRFKTVFCLILVISIISLMCVSIVVGAAKSVTIGYSFKVLVNQILPGTFEVPDNVFKIVENIRLPRIYMALFAGIILALGGTIMQTLMNNPLATPYTLGISSAASFGACLALAFGINLASSTLAVATNAFLFSLLPLGIIMLCAKVRRMSPVMIVLMGVAISYIFNALLTIMEYFVDSDVLSSVVFWTVGDLSHAFMWQIKYVAIAAVILLIFTVLMSKPLNIMRMGDDTAKSLGVNVDTVRLVCIMAACLGTALVISFIGTIGFVCLLAPQICRYIIGGELKGLAVSSALMGAVILLVADILSKYLVDPALLPVGAVTALIGGPVLVLLLVKAKGVDS